MHSIEDIKKLLETEYDLTGNISRLAGENENYLVKTKNGISFVLKLADDQVAPGILEIEHLAVERLLQAGLNISLPRIILTRTGSIEARLLPQDQGEIRGRLLKFLEGTAWREALPASIDQLEELGSLIAQMNLALSGIVHPDSNRTHPWDLANADQHRSSILIIEDPEKRRILEWVFHFYAAIAMPLLDRLPRALIHGDLNDDNVLVQNGRISSILDFGDCLENPMVCDLAIALAYHTLDEDDPLEAAAIMIGAFHKVRPLSLDEMTVIFPLMCARLAVSAIISAKRRKIDPERESWFVSEQRAWQKLEVFSTIGPAQAAIILAGRTDLKPYENRGASATELLKKRKKVIAPSILPSYDKPLKFLYGKGQYLFDYNGRPFLDLYNNVCHVGHCHPRVVEAGQKQMARLNTNTRYLYDGLTEYAERLCDTLPEELDTCFFVNSGSEANELALRIARTCTGQKDMLVVDNAYHGHTTSLIDISPYKFMGKGGKGESEPWVHIVPVADGYRGRFKGQGKDTGIAYGNEIENIIDSLDTPIAGFITEALLSCGGQVIPPKGYFETAFRHVRNAGGLCIVDEVQTGFGRVGSRFWAFELQGVIPDMVVMGKPMGNGHPMAAVVTRREIADIFANGMEFFSTFGGNPVSCVIGLAVLDVIKEEGLQERAHEIGKRMLAGLQDLKGKHDIIGDVRGVGLFIGIELVMDRETMEPAHRQAYELVDRLKARGILLGTDGPFNNVIKIKPPMVIAEEDSDMFIRILDDALTDMENSG